RVFAHFLAEHRCGRTPNPDVLCNREIKFGIGLAWARRLGAQRFATGHYARLEPFGAGMGLYKARDASKDQSYFLHAVSPAHWPEVLMPLGDWHKEAVRERARKAGLPVYDKPDSTGICFIGERPFFEFLSRFLERRPGVIETPGGERMGEHQGLAFYTVGQRAGLHIGGRSGHSHLPWYVAGKDAARNALIVVQGHDHPLLASGMLKTGAWHWLVAPRGTPFRADVKVRYRQQEQPARLDPHRDGTLRVIFEQPQRAVTVGQYAVAYEADLCLGGGVIDTVAAANTAAVAA
ncbi:MAG: tRNA 2-thiouridine(34) synthase MnmA, partial [Gammaproteobacteria bacterium]|nr:tRNA 2-thiouridine(34) synthase MnmA [Gammaproteobacteria bacterium]